MMSDKNIYEHINLEYLHEMADGDEDFMKEMIVEYLNKIPLYIKDLVKAIEDENIDNIIFFAHKLKSSFQYMGVKRLSAIAEQMEQNAKELIHDDMKSMLQEIHQVFEKVVAELTSELKKLEQ